MYEFLRDEFDINARLILTKENTKYDIALVKNKNKNRLNSLFFEFLVQFNSPTVRIIISVLAENYAKSADKLSLDVYCTSLRLLVLLLQETENHVIIINYFIRITTIVIQNIEKADGLRTFMIKKI